MSHVRFLSMLAVAAFLIPGCSPKADEAKAAVNPTVQDCQHISLGEFFREIPSGNQGRHKEKFNVEISLVLNPDFGTDLTALRSRLDQKRDYLRDLINSRILYTKNEKEFSKPNFLPNLAQEIHRVLNHEMGYDEKGRTVILTVIFPKINALPQAR